MALIMKMGKQDRLKYVSAYALLAACCSSVAHADFIQDSETSLNFRNFYLERDFDSAAPDIGSWSQAAGIKFASGYTDTPLQVGLDLTANYALRLSDQNEQRPDTVLPFEDGKQVRDYHKLGATLKLKYQDSELRIGELMPRSPVAFIDDSRQLVTTYAGVAFETKAIDQLKLSLGRITHINARNEDSFEKLSLFVPNGPRFESDGLNYLGLDYNFTPQISGAYWFGQLEDIYQQHYANAAYSTQMGGSKVKFDARYFNNSESGDAYYGKIDSQSFGVQANLNNGPHTLTAGVQKNKGESAFPTLAGYAPQPFLHTWSLLGFIKPEELTYHVLYSYDFKDLGVPGLRATARYLHGSDIERPGLNDNEETETNFILGYTVPEGTFKGLGLEWRYIDTTTKYGAGNTSGTDFVENRIITTYSYKF